MTDKFNDRIGGPAAGGLLPANNLSDVDAAATSLSNIGGIGAATSDTLTNKTFDANGTGNVLTNIDIGNAIAASQAEAEAGTDATKLVTSLRVAQAIAALGGAGAGLTSIASGSFGAVTLLDITSIPATFRSLLLFVNGASNTVATRGLEIEIDTGAGLGTATNESSYLQTSSTTPTAVVIAAQKLWTTVTQAATNLSSCSIEFPAYQNTSPKTYHGHTWLAAVTNPIAGTQGWVDGVLTDTAAYRTGAITGIRITWDNVATGVFDAGTYELFGVN